GDNCFRIISARVLSNLSRMNFRSIAAERIPWRRAETLSTNCAGSSVSSFLEICIASGKRAKRSLVVSLSFFIVASKSPHSSRTSCRVAGIFRSVAFVDSNLVDLAGELENGTTTLISLSLYGPVLQEAQKTSMKRIKNLGLKYFDVAEFCERIPN